MALLRVDVVKPHDAQENMFISSLSETLQRAENIWFASFELCSTPLYFISAVFIFSSSVCLACAHVGVMDVAAVKVIPRDWQQFSTSFSHKPLSAQKPDSRLKTSHYSVLRWPVQTESNSLQRLLAVNVERCFAMSIASAALGAGSRSGFTFQFKRTQTRCLRVNLTIFLYY